jgi:hypothetical protein
MAESGWRRNHKNRTRSGGIQPVKRLFVLQNGQFLHGKQSGMDDKAVTADTLPIFVTQLKERNPGLFKL